MGEMSIDGGKVRLRTAKGKALIWRDYKVVSFHQLGVVAFFQDNSALLNEIKAMRQEQSRANSKPTIIENSMNGTRFGTAVAMNTYKIQ